MRPFESEFESMLDSARLNLRAHGSSIGTENLFEKLRSRSSFGGRRVSLTRKTQWFYEVEGQGSQEGLEARCEARRGPRDPLGTALKSGAPARVLEA